MLRRERKEDEEEEWRREKKYFMPALAAAVLLLLPFPFFLPFVWIARRRVCSSGRRSSSSSLLFPSTPRAVLFWAIRTKYIALLSFSFPSFFLLRKNRRQSFILGASVEGTAGGGGRKCRMTKRKR